MEYGLGLQEFAKSFCSFGQVEIIVAKEYVKVERIQHLPHVLN